MNSLFDLLVSLLTFPGVIAHEWAHKKFCNWLGVPVQKVVYFQFKNPVGSVTHAQPATYAQTFWISMGPLVVNSAAAIIIAKFALKTPGVSQSWTLIWLALSIGMHALPSKRDVTNISSALKEKGFVLSYLSLPFVWLIQLANILRFFWFDLFYAIALIAVAGGFRL